MSKLHEQVSRTTAPSSKLLYLLVRLFGNRVSLCISTAFKEGIKKGEAMGLGI
jgi:hypothetical protein